jgi:hypothetical protein
MFLLRLIGLILLVANAGFFVQTLRAILKPERYNKNFVRPVMAMELVRCAGDVERVLTDIKRYLPQPKPDEFLRHELKKDSRYIIPTYWLFLMFVSFLLFRHQFPQARWLGIAAAICATAAAAFDYLENHRTKLALDDHQLAASVRQASLCKWGLIFVAVGLLASMFLWRQDWVMAVGALYLLAALTGLAGLWQDRLIEWSFMPLLAGGAGVGALLLFAPQRFTAGFS